MRIPVIVCHGLTTATRYPLYPESPLSTDRMEGYLKTIFEYGFNTISYANLEKWKQGHSGLPTKPILLDFDHPAKSIHYEIFPIMQRFGFIGTLFINTEPMEEMYYKPIPEFKKRIVMTWEEIRELIDAGWGIGAHTHSHPNLSELSTKDPSGSLTEHEMVKCDLMLNSKLGVTPLDFAFTGNSWSTIAETAAKKRYRFARLWITGELYEADGHLLRYAELVKMPGKDEPDGGPPIEARYITAKTDPYRIPSMELQKLIYDYNKFRSYLEEAVLSS